MYQHPHRRGSRGREIQGSRVGTSQSRDQHAFSLVWPHRGVAVPQRTMVSSQTAWVCHSRSNSAHQISSHHQIYEVDRSLLDDLGLQGTGFKLLTNAGPISSSTMLPSFSVAQKRMLLGCVRACGGGGEDGVCPRQVTVGSVASTQAPPNFIVQTAENGRPFLVLCRTPGMLEMPEGTRAIAWCGPGLVNARVSALWRYTSGLSSTR